MRSCLFGSGTGNSSTLLIRSFSSSVCWTKTLHLFISSSLLPPQASSSPIFLTPLSLPVDLKILLIFCGKIYKIHHEIVLEINLHVPIVLTEQNGRVKRVYSYIENHLTNTAVIIFCQFSISPYYNISWRRNECQ